MDDEADDDRRNDAGHVADEVEYAASHADGISRGDIADGAPDDSRHALSEKGDGHDGNDRFKGIDVVGRHDRHGTDEAADNRRLAGLGQAGTALQHRIRPVTAQEDAAERAYIGDDGVEAGLEHRHLLGYDQVRRKPGQEEIHSARVGKLPQVYAQELAVLEQVGQLGPGNLRGLRCPIGQAAAFADIGQLGFIHVLAFVGFAVQQIPEQAGDDADDAGYIKYEMPRIVVEYPEQDRRQESQADEFTGCIDGCSHGPFLVGEPAGHDAAVRREGRCFSSADSQADAKESGKAAAEAHGHREQRPQEQGYCIGHMRTEPFQEQTTRNLHEPIGPAKGGKQQAHGRRIEAQVSAHARCGYGHIRTVQIIDCRQKEQ